MLRDYVGSVLLAFMAEWIVQLSTSDHNLAVTAAMIVGMCQGNRFRG